MKIPIILLVLAVFFGSFFITDSNAILGPGAPQEDPSLPEISIQIQIRNSDGVLVAYTEPTIYYLNRPRFFVASLLRMTFLGKAALGNNGGCPNGPLTKLKNTGSTATRR